MAKEAIKHVICRRYESFSIHLKQITLKLKMCAFFAQEMFLPGNNVHEL